MKREIKFRAWNKRLKKMFAVYAIDWKNGLVYCEGDDGNPHTFGLADVELMQNTCLPDKNGKEIYEGDIVSTDLDRPFNIVIFRNGSFMKDYFDLILSPDDELDNWKFGEVIGNIYENPELLEAGT